MGMHSLEISGKSCTNTALLCRCVDRDKDQISLLDGLVNIGGEEEVATAGLADNGVETWLVDGEVELGAVPRIDTGLVQVHNGDLNVGALQSNDSASGATWQQTSTSPERVYVVSGVVLTNISSTNYIGRGD